MNRPPDDTPTPAPDPEATKPVTTTGSQPLSAQPSVHERLDGLRNWLAQLERKLGVRTYVGAAASVLALAAGIAALVLALQANRDNASKADVDELGDQITAVSREAGEATQRDLDSLASRIDELDQRISSASGQADTAKKQISVLEDDVEDLRQQISDLESSNSGGGSGGGGSNQP